MDEHKFNQFLFQLSADLTVLNSEQLQRVADIVEVQQVNNLAEQHGYVDMYREDGLLQRVAAA